MNNPIGLLLVVFLVLMLLGGLPYWGWHSYGYAPSGALGLLVLILVILLLSGRL